MDTTAYAASQQMGYGAATDTRANRPLETIAHAAQRVNTATVAIQAFIDRFHGAQPTEAAPPTAAEPPNASQPPYDVSLNRLFACLDRLETRVDALSHIG